MPRLVGFGGLGTCLLLAAVTVTYVATTSAGGRDGDATVSDSFLNQTAMLDLPPRLMWGWGDGLSGYCGSASIQTAALYYGNWLTQDAIRGTTGGHSAKDQVLLGVNAEAAASKMHLNITAWDFNRAQPQADAFLKWSKEGLSAGEPIIFGVFMVGDDDGDYDHIVPMVGFDADTIYFNDLHANQTTSKKIAQLVTSRKGCNRKGVTSMRRYHSVQDGSVQFEYCLPKQVDYGMRVHGIVDGGGETLPAKLIMGSWYEPDYSSEDQLHETPVTLGATLRISGLTAGETYAVLRYDSADVVPKSDFLAGAYVDKQTFSASNSEHEMQVSFQSDSTTFYRCVRNS